MLSESFRAKLRQEFPKSLNNWQVKVITGENFNMSQILQPWQVPLKSTEFVVFVFKSFDSDTAGDSKLFQCKYGGLCHKITPNLSKFMDHMRTHTKERPFKCTYPGCGKAFSQKTNVKQHIKEVHQQLKPFKCDYCDKTFSKKYNRNSHMETICEKRYRAMLDKEKTSLDEVA